MCVHLDKVDALPEEVNGYILEGFSQCLVVEFREIHKLLYTTIKVRQMQAVSGRWESSTNYVAVQKLCGEANDVFHSLNLTNKWNIPQGHREDAVVFACDNCESPTHASLNVLFHTMKQGSRRPKSCTQILMMEAVLVVVDVDVDVDMDVVMLWWMWW